MTDVAVREAELARVVRALTKNNCELAESLFAAQRQIAELSAELGRINSLLQSRADAK
jgi:hypothetical protein